ncbi:integrin alpha-11a [Callorhinchus milii]|uniref:integrin alpha-11a n=1 Tax=Callorhinchus milii TaxID=7868 RepID=UPI001C3FE4E6|nr:integrin alpha-11a [Callorhinchus milii]
MDFNKRLIVTWMVALLPGLCSSFNIDTKRPKIIRGSSEAQFGYTVQQHEANGQKWLLVGAPWDGPGKKKTGDVYRCPVRNQTSFGCGKLNLGRVSLPFVSEHKDDMRLGMTLTSNPEDNSFVTCGPLWSHECGSSYYSTGLCCKISSNFKSARAFAPAIQRCETYMDIVIVLDGSNSIYPWYEVQTFLISILKKFYIGPGQIRLGIVQYGETAVHEFELRDYTSVSGVVKAARSIEQRGGTETNTAHGIEIARSEAFSTSRGAREGAKKVMIVITDGESHDSPHLKKVIENSERDNITRYSIAVLGYYNRRGINPTHFLKEIKSIASEPWDKHFFNVSDEAALKDIVDALGARIFSLEGTNVQNETSFQLEMSQAGFSTHVVEDGILLGAVGAYDWTGAVLKQTSQGRVIPPKDAYAQEFPEELKNHGAYLGYTINSVTLAPKRRWYVAGAPRFNHTGKVVLFTMKNNGSVTIRQSLKGQQIGSYFGSEINSLDVDADGVTDILLVGAPMYFSNGREKGRIYIYALKKNTFAFDNVLEVTDRSQNSRFGSAIAAVPDLNHDFYNDLVVGAPLEDENRGVIYVFHGLERNIQRNYKQRISAREIGPAILYFGRSIHGQLDMNDDGLVDLAVGALGRAIQLWSRSIIQVNASMRFEPPKINIFNKDCKRNGKECSCMSVLICFTITAKSPGLLNDSLVIQYNTTIDERRYTPRALFDENFEKNVHNNITVVPELETCDQISFHVLDTMDYVRPIGFILDFMLSDPDYGPVLDDGWPTTVKTSLGFWSDCGEDEHCVPDLLLRVQSNVHGSSQFPFSIESSRRRLVLEVWLENRRENAYNTVLNATFSRNLRFATMVQRDDSDAKIDCLNLEKGQRNKLCTVGYPVFRSQSRVAFRLEFEFSHSVFLGTVEVVLTTSSDGDEAEETLADNTFHLWVPVRYEADLLLTRESNPMHFEVQSTHDPDTGDDRDPPFNFTFTLQNMGRFPVGRLLVTVTVPAMTEANNLLLLLTDNTTDPVDGMRCSLINHPDIQRWHLGARDTTLEDLRHHEKLDASNAKCTSLLCEVADLGASEMYSIHIFGRLQMDSLTALKFRSLLLVTTASLEIKEPRPMFIREDRRSRHIALRITGQYESEVPLWIIIGSLLGGLLLLALLILALWKLGFFQSAHHKRKQSLTDQNSSTAQS